jgi:hypothetical protein
MRHSITEPAKALDKEERIAFVLLVEIRQD